MKLNCPIPKRWLESPRIYFLVLLCAALLLSPAIFTGFSLDDYILRTITLQNHFFPNQPDSPLDAFVLFQNDNQGMRQWIERGLLPWWTHPKMRMAFWRPLSAVTHWVDFKLYPGAPWLMHVHNLVWYGMLGMLGLILYRRFFPAYCQASFSAERILQIAGIAALLYAADDAHGFGVGWISNRNAVIAAAFAITALLLHDRWRQRGWQAGACLSPVFLGLGLLSGESALAICGYFIAYALFLDSGRLLHRLSSLIPCAAVVVIWRMIYARLGYGAIETGLYLDPGQNPAAFFAELVQRLPVLLLGQLGLPNSVLWATMPGIWPAVICVFALVFLAFCGWMLWPMLRRDRLARFFALGMVLAAIPSCATYPNDRLLFFTGIGGMGLVMHYLAIARQFLQDGLPVFSERPPAAVRALLIIWVAIHMVLGPLSLPVVSVTPLFFQRALDRGASTLPARERGQAVIVNLPTEMMLPYIYLTHAYREAAEPAASWLLSSGITAVEIEGIDAHTVVVRPEAGLFSQPWDRVFRNNFLQVAQGFTFGVKGMTVLVTQTTADGRPAEIRYSFEKSVDDPQLQWLVWSSRGFVPFKPPGAGERKRLERPSLFWWM